jgi:prepilin-type processing-associated H-X9-DG protein
MSGVYHRRKFTEDWVNLEADLGRDGVRNLFRCWSQEPQGRATSMGDGMGWSPPAEWSSYIFNEALLARRNQPWDFPQGHMSKIRRPGAVMFAMDANPRDFLMVFDMNQNYTMWDFHNLVLDRPSQYGPEPIDFVRHRYRGNVLFCDWHVESLPLTEAGLKAIGISNGIYQ